MIEISLVSYKIHYNEIQLGTESSGDVLQCNLKLMVLIGYYI